MNRELTVNVIMGSSDLINTWQLRLDKGLSLDDLNKGRRQRQRCAFFSRLAVITVNHRDIDVNAAQ